MKVFSGIRADDIDLGRSRAVGVQHLKSFLDYAVRGAVALPAQDTGSQGEMESPFEEAVAAQLERRGWQVVPQVGVSGFRIDLGVRHPDHAGLYLAGIECDGASYHSSATARDRDKVREQVLRGLGWTILRVWSTDWWFNAGEAIERLHQGLETALAESRATRKDTSAEEPSVSTDASDMATAESAADDEPARSDAIVEPANGSLASEISPSILGEKQFASLYPPIEETLVDSDRPTFAITDLSGFEADPDCFFDFAYRPTLQAMVDAILAQEAPVRDDVLAQRVARAHGWLRTGGRIRAQIELHLRKLDRTQETSGTFLWKPGTIQPRLPFRRPLEPQHRRALADICIAELTDFVLEHRAALDEEDPPLIYARLLHVDRLANSSRQRLQEAIAVAESLASDAPPHGSSPDAYRSR